MMITLRHLYYLSLVARAGSFRAAAEAAQVSQPVISSQIAAIETYYGAKLFNRVHSGARPTALGWDYIRSADRILAEFSRMEDRLRAGVEGGHGSLSIGYYKSISAGTLRACLKSMVRSYPGIRIPAREACLSELVHAVRNGALDLAVLATEAGSYEQLETLPLWSDRVMVALPEGHALAERDFILWTDLVGETFLFSRRDPGSDLTDLLRRQLAAPGQPPDIVVMDTTREDVINMVGIGAGISLQCEAAIGLTGLGVVFREVRDTTGASRMAYSACWRSDNQNPALAIFLDLLRNGGRVEAEPP